MSPVILKVALSAIAGTLASTLVGCLPALHVYNVAMLMIVFHEHVAQSAWGSDQFILMPFLMGLIVGWAVLNTVPAVFLGAPDESAMLMVFPTQKYLMQGRGYEATMLSGLGALGGAMGLLLVAPLLPTLLPIARNVLSPHLFWLLALIIAYMVMSEFPRGGDRGPTPLARFWDAWKSLLAGILTLVLAGWLGFLLMRRAPIGVTFEFSKIMPAFVGLFGIPWVLQNIASGTEVPPQYVPRSADATPFIAFRGISAGFLGGFFAAFFPIVTGGIGGLLAGHATAQNDERAFIISQGASKFVYYVGAFLLFFVPAANLARGGLGHLVRTMYIPRTMGEYLMILGAMALSSGLAFLLLGVMARLIIWLIQRINYRYLSWLTLFIMLGLVFAMTGWGGLFITVVSTAIGLIPVVFHARRSHCMGVLLLPVTIEMAGYGPQLARLMGLT
ncbi:MAG: tripartite tricarboxylate transporter permease [bacterium]|nr:tripartite tricarboxylate transporter permease [bacterium]